ncbi:Acetyl-coenzyme A carboxylase carboxyl transferase subunit beta chloroplastic [Bienertia sinuspersici]
MSSSDGIEHLIDPGTWSYMDDDMISVGSIEFHSKEEAYKVRINSLVIEKWVQMKLLKQEKITRLIEFAANKCLPIIIICASRGARMKEGSLSLMKMENILSVLYDYQSNKNLFYVPILTFPTTGGETTNFGMLGDIIIAEPNAYIALRVKE